MWAWILAFGALPALWVARVRVRALPWRRELAVKALGMALAAATLGAIAFANFPHYAALLRNHRELRFLLAPHNVAAAAYGYLRQRFRASGALALEPVGADAARAIATRAERPRLTFLVIGETARAENFSLNGYGRPTTPELARRDVLSFTDVRACGTSTAVSLPCMFLDVGRAGFSAGLAQRRENLLDVLQRAGVSVLWRENNSGCKGICDRVPRHDAAALRVPELCAGGECLDEVLLNGLQEHLDRLEGDAIVVLHMTGSHGPAYFRRYPPAFEVFAPACGTVELDRCPRESVLNAYDNSIRYTDYVLGRMIDLLRDNARRFDAGLLYVSDHGESLGENGLYLHGMPYALAPRQQTQVPMVLWLSEGLRRRMEIDMTCLASRAHETRSHDDLFHSVLGLHEVRTTAYRPERDLLRPCRPAAAPTHVVAR
jgi:lipid A ethanolaminephosphotransferase